MVYNSNMHVLNSDQFSTEELEKLFASAEKMRELSSSRKGRLELSRRFEGRQICTLFYEPSTRTRISFESAALKLGMGVASTENAGEFSSAAKGETIEDTIHVLDEYGFEAVIIRHNVTGEVAKAAAVSRTPVINAGDGKGEHPTQSLLDIYTIWRQFKRLDNLRVVIGGDLRNGRTARSLARMLSKYPGNHLTFISLPSLSMGDDVKETLKQSGTAFTETEKTHEAFKDADAVYWTRLQKERLDSSNKLAGGGFIIDKKALALLPKDAIIMHPLPRVDEIAVEVDSDPRARYFEQVGNGLYVRMALLDRIAGLDA